MNNYPADWEKRRLTVFKRDGWECRGCEFIPEEKDGKELHAHHVKPISEGGGHSLDNLMTLCEDCHNDVHSSAQDPPLEPIQTWECAYCGVEYGDGEGYDGSYCSTNCVARVMAEKAENVIIENPYICATCYSPLQRHADSCPSCGNWNHKVERRDDLNVESIDVHQLLAAALHWYRFESRYQNT